MKWNRRGSAAGRTVLYSLSPPPTLPLMRRTPESRHQWGTPSPLMTTGNISQLFFNKEFTQNCPLSGTCSLNCGLINIL